MKRQESSGQLESDTISRSVKNDTKYNSNLVRPTDSHVAAEPIPWESSGNDAKVNGLFTAQPRTTVLATPSLLFHQGKTKCTDHGAVSRTLRDDSRCLRNEYDIFDYAFHGSTSVSTETNCSEIPFREVATEDLLDFRESSAELQPPWFPPPSPFSFEELQKFVRL